MPVRLQGMDEGFDLEIDFKDDAKRCIGGADRRPLAIKPLIEKTEHLYGDRPDMRRIAEKAVVARMRHNDFDACPGPTDTVHLAHDGKKDLRALPEVLKYMHEFDFIDTIVIPRPWRRFEINHHVRLTNGNAIDIDEAGHFAVAATEIEFQGRCR